MTTSDPGHLSPPDQASLDAFSDRLFNDMSGAMLSLLCHLGDRLGLFAALAARGPATSAELATRAGVAERYAREWLRALSSGGYLAYDPASERFTLPPAHGIPLAQFGGIYQQLGALVRVLDPVAAAFR